MHLLLRLLQEALHLNEVPLDNVEFPLRSMCHEKGAGSGCLALGKITKRYYLAERPEVSPRSWPDRPAPPPGLRLRRRRHPSLTIECGGRIPSLRSQDVQGPLTLRSSSPPDQGIVSILNRRGEGVGLDGPVPRPQQIAGKALPHLPLVDKKAAPARQHPTSD